jgi:hypothetical protein
MPPGELQCIKHVCDAAGQTQPLGLTRQPDKNDGVHAAALHWKMLVGDVLTQGGLCDLSMLINQATRAKKSTSTSTQHCNLTYDA